MTQPITLSLEQMTRDLLAKAIADDLVAPSENYGDPDPQLRTSGELAGVANLLGAMLRMTNEPVKE